MLGLFSGQIYNKNRQNNNHMDHMSKKLGIFCGLGMGWHQTVLIWVVILLFFLWTGYGMTRNSTHMNGNLFLGWGMICGDKTTCTHMSGNAVYFGGWLGVTNKIYSYEWKCFLLFTLGDDSGWPKKYSYEWKYYVLQGMNWGDNKNYSYESEMLFILWNSIG